MKIIQHWAHFKELRKSRYLFLRQKSVKMLPVLLVFKQWQFFSHFQPSSSHHHAPLSINLCHFGITLFIYFHNDHTEFPIGSIAEISGQYNLTPIFSIKYFALFSLKKLHKWTVVCNKTNPSFILITLINNNFQSASIFHKFMVTRVPF